MNSKTGQQSPGLGFKGEKEWQKEKNAGKSISKTGQNKVNDAFAAPAHLPDLKIDQHQAEQANIDREVPGIEESHTAQYQRD